MKKKIKVVQKKAKQQRQRYDEWKVHQMVPEKLDVESSYIQEEWITKGEDNKQHPPPFFRKRHLFIRFFLSGLLVIFAIFLFRVDTVHLQHVRGFVLQKMNEDFPFATVNKWYEERFGSLLAFFPNQTKGVKVKTEQTAKYEMTYALPASGKIISPFQKETEGILIETKRNASVDAINEGYVIYASKKENIGNTIIIQHPNGQESWYGQLGDIQAKLYSHVQKGEKIGVVLPDQGQGTGTFYFALKEGETFIDPKTVIDFE